MYVDASVSFTGLTSNIIVVVSLPSGNNSICYGYYNGSNYNCYNNLISIGTTFTQVSPGVFTATDGDRSCYYNYPPSVYSSTITVSCGASAAVTSVVQTGCAYAVAVTTPGVCPPLNPPTVSITLCAGTTVASAALVVVPGSVVSIGCTRVTTPPSCVLDGGGVKQLLLVKANASVTLTGLALNNGTGAESLYGATYGGAVYVSSGATLTANGDVFKHDHAVLGGAVYESNATVNVSNTAFSSDTASANGGAVYANQGTVAAFNASFINASAGYGGALYESYAVINATNASFVGGVGTYGQACCGHAARRPLSV